MVCPPSAMLGWADELYDSRQDHTLMLGTKEQREILLNLAHFPDPMPFRFWWIVNWQAHRCLKLHNPKWDCVILDETSLYLRNPRSQVTKYFTTHFRNVPHRWILTGTPRPESDMDWYCQLKFLYERPFGFSTYWNFRIKCFTQVGYNWHLRNDRRHELKHYVAENAFTCKRRDWAMEPAKRTIRRSIQMPPDIRDLTKQVETEWTLNDQATKWSLNLHHWLRKLASGIGEDGELLHPFKIEALAEILGDELKGECVIIVCNYNSEIASICKHLRLLNTPHAAILGKVSQQKRLDLIRRFQEGEYLVLVLQQAVAQTGLELSIANSCIFYSLPESGNAYAQIQDRMVHMSKLSQPLTYYYLMTADSIDQDIYNAVHVKRLKSEIQVQAVIQAGIESRTKS